MDGDVFLVPLNGRSVECTSIEDAIAIKTADDLLRDGDACTPSELHRLAGILTRYGCRPEAEKLSSRASRIRAAQFLKETIGYERPDGSV